MPAVLNAANEVAVAAFLEGKISFPDIVSVVSGDHGRRRAACPPRASLEEAEAIDRAARRDAASAIVRRRRGGRRRLMTSSSDQGARLTILEQHPGPHRRPLRARRRPRVRALRRRQVLRLPGRGLLGRLRQAPLRPKWRGTDYRVSAIPLGGYVRVIGLGPDESTVTEGTSREAPPVGKRWQRALVLLAGPGDEPRPRARPPHGGLRRRRRACPPTSSSRPSIRVVEPGLAGEPRPASSPATASSRSTGSETPRWRDAQFIFAMNAREKLDVEVDRDGVRRASSRSRREPSTKYDLGDVGLLPDVGANVRGRDRAWSSAGRPAERAGLKPGDVIALGRPARTIQGAPDRDASTSSSRPSHAARRARSRSSTCATASTGDRRRSRRARRATSWKVGVQVGGGPAGGRSSAFRSARPSSRAGAGSRRTSA